SNYDTSPWTGQRTRVSGSESPVSGFVSRKVSPSQATLKRNISPISRFMRSVAAPSARVIVISRVGGLPSMSLYSRSPIESSTFPLNSLWMRSFPLPPGLNSQVRLSSPPSCFSVNSHLPTTLEPPDFPLPHPASAATRRNAPASRTNRICGFLLPSNCRRTLYRLPTTRRHSRYRGQRQPRYSALYSDAIRSTSARSP